MEPKYFDIKKIKVSGEPIQPSFRERIGQKIAKQKKILALRWEFLDLSLSGVLVYGLVVILAFGGAIVTTRLISASVNKKPKLEIAPTFSDFKVEVNEKKKSSPTQVKESTKQNPFKFIQQETSETAKVAKDSFQIRILNGNGKAGDAARTKQELSSKGFKIGSVGNAKHKYSQTQIYYLADKEKEAKLIAENLEQKTEIHQADSSLIGNSYDILIVLGIK